VSEVLWLDVLGVTAKVTLHDPDLGREVSRAWSACLLEPATDGAVAFEIAESMDASLGADLPARLELVTQSLTVSAIEHLAGERLMLHACAVADETSQRCVIFVGPSGMGKTTVATTLGQQWNYVTDECVSVNEDGLVTPFPKPLSVVQDPGPTKAQVSPCDLGLEPARSASTPVGLLLLHRDRTRAAPAVEEVSTVKAVALLAEHSSYLASLAKPLSHLARLVHAAGGLRVVRYAEAADLAPLVGGAFAESPR
jgi:hypothetical protein